MDVHKVDYNDLNIYATELEDLYGQSYSLGSEEEHVVLLIFIDPECPVSIFYVPKMNEIKRMADSLQVAMYTVLSSPYLIPEQAKKFIRDYHLEIETVVDSEGFLAKQLSPQVVPEVYLINHKNALVYKGAINSEFAALGKRRSTGIKEYLTDILTQEKFYYNTYTHTDAVGCIFEPW